MTGDNLPAVLVTLVGARRVLMVDPSTSEPARRAAAAVGPQGSVVVLVRDGAAGWSDGVEVVVGDPVESLPHLRTDDDTTFGVVTVDVTRASVEDALQYVEWALVLGRPGTALVVGGSGDAFTAVRGALDRHPRIDAASWDTGDSALAVAVLTDQR
ncbi:hypothetical protein [Rhodococcus sp. MEB064]|uniref:hypothetical protein n=1 Tax=Rhodococcus sp. MEB064 TaxID=1587522 RepID=UPI0005ABEDF2|nr:hypothetical protein [Rhodococcus sp. MEB064]KIQ20620.1 hypothetical protein RU01_00635 [Rhodococcus sp. MEB064]